MDYFDIAGLKKYSLIAKTTYSKDTAEAKWFYDTRTKLEYLVKLIGESNAKTYHIVYSQKPNGQGGRAKINFKNYVLTGFSNTNKFGNDLFMKFAFANLKEEPVFDINIDLDFRTGNSFFKKRRDEIFSKHYVSWNIDETFPDNWEDLVKLIIEPVKSLEENFNNYLSELKNSNIKNKIMVLENEKINGYVNLLEYKKQIILQGPPGTGKTKMAKEIALDLISDNTDVYNDKNVVFLNKESIKKILSIGQTLQGRNDSFEVVSFDDSGVFLKTYKSKSEGWKASFSQILKSYEQKLFEKESRTGNGSYEDAVAIFMNDHFKGKNIELRKTIDKFSYIVQFHPSYTYEDFVRGIIAETNSAGQIEYKVVNKILAELAESALKNRDKKFVLIIDEINRANLSSVLGELIFGLEYRYYFNDSTEKQKESEVESLYALKNEFNNFEESRVLKLPENLYIIGTMNTADRSVGHIDYAIRRRFAFVDVLPEKLEDNNEIWFNTSAYDAVEKLFNKSNVSADFDVKDIQIGHSYFIVKKENTKPEEKEAIFKMKMKYEVIPILNEYVKDGILIPETKKLIDQLSVAHS